MRKLSRAESGKLGAAKSKIILAAAKQTRIDEYNLNPKHCKHCGAVLSYQDNVLKKVFCNHHCSATYNNLKKAQKVKWECLSCGKEHNSLPHKVGSYCGISCFNEARMEKTFTKLLSGELNDRGMMRSAIIRKYGSVCADCGLFEWRGEELPLELHHKDGDAGNNEYSNISLLCPNCHAITDTWKGKNRGNGRAARGLSLN